MNAGTNRSIRVALCALAGLAGLALACHGHDEGASESHGQGHGHGHGHGAEGGAEPSALTLWTATHELFVEFDALVAGKSSGYHAHVSRILDNQPATAGTFSVRFIKGAAVAREISVAKVAREGIFIPKGVSPHKAGKYQLVFAFEHKEQKARWDAGQITLGPRAASMAERPEGSITFLKEQAWRIPFSTVLPSRRAVHRQVILPARITADPTHSHAITAPSAGAVFWAGKGGPVVTGMTVKRGQVIGRLLPAAAPEHWTSLQLQTQRALIGRQHAQQILSRVAGLAKEGLLPARRVADARAVLGRAEATLRASRQKVGLLRGSGPSSMFLVAPADGTLVEVHVTDGHQAKAGVVLAHIASGATVLVRAPVFPLDLPRISDIRTARLVLPGTREAITLDNPRARLLTDRLVVDPETLSADVVYGVRNSDPQKPLRIGEQGELVLGVGQPRRHLVVPTAAVVEINTRPHLFVMRTGESFDRLQVRLGPDDGKWTAVLGGLEPKDRVVVQGAFDVYAASLAGAVESHRH